MVQVPDAMASEVLTHGYIVLEGELLDCEPDVTEFSPWVALRDGPVQCLLGQAD